MKNLKSKSLLTMLMVLALLVATASMAFADFNKFLVKADDGKFYEYNQQELNDSYTAFQVLGATSPAAAMYNQFAALQAAGADVVALGDSVRGWMDYAAAQTASIAAQIAEIPFVINDFLALPASPVYGETVTNPIVVNPDGTLTPTVDLAAYDAARAQATAAVQADYTAASWTALQTALTNNVVDGNNTQVEIDAAAANINAAYAALVKVLKVESVSAINAKQIQVVYSSPVDPTIAKDVTNYSLKTSGTVAFPLATTTAASVLSADGKTITITLVTPLNNAGNVMSVGLNNGDTFQVVTKNIKDVAKTQTLPTITTNVVYSDTAKPEFVSATASAKTTTNTITLAFNEPVDITTASLTVNGTAASLAAGTKANEVVATTGSNLTAGTTYNLVLLNFKDYAANLMATNPLATTVTVTADAVAPVVTKVEVIRDSLIEVTFDKAMNTTTLTNTSVKLYDPNLLTTGITQTGAVTVKANTDNKTFSVPIAAVPFNTSGVFTGILSFTNNIKDSSGNALVATTQPVTLTKDTTAPTVVSSTYVNTTTYNGIATTNGAIVVKFNEPVTYFAANTTYTVVDNLGTVILTPLVAHTTATAGINVNPNDLTELVLPLAANVGSTITSYTVVMPTGAAKDLTIAANASASVNLTVNVSAGPPVAADTLKPVVASATPTVATSTTPTTIAVAYTEAGSGLNTATVIDTNNYRLDGTPLPGGSYITLAGTTATITVPMGTIAKDKAYALNINAIADKAGNVMDPYIGSVTLRDDIAPTMTTAVLNTNGTVSVGFDETMLTGVAKEAGLTFVINGSTLSGANIAYTIADGLGSDAGKYVATVNTRRFGIAAVGGVVTAPTGTYTGTGTNVMKFVYIDVNGDQLFSATDIVVSAVDQGNATAIAEAPEGTYNLNNASSITVTSTGTTIKDASLIGNLLKAATTITVK